jgi:hypothetical protein
MQRLFLLFALTAFFCFTALAAGHFNPGTPSWSAYDSGQYDTINLQNLNVSLNVPVMSKTCPCFRSRKNTTNLFWSISGLSRDGGDSTHVRRRLRLVSLAPASAWMRSASARVSNVCACFAVDDFASLKASKLNRDQRSTRARPQLIQHRPFTVYKIQ